MYKNAANIAILLPYTHPSRYNNYVVSLAHHVIAAWFLKCRLSYRRNFVRFIIHGLHNYTLMPFEINNIAILLPYTNPSRYNNYVVSLAHHVIAAWFLKYRRNFVRFIIHGLHNYTLMPFEINNIAILLPYTNPSRYNNYVVSLAHHVIAAWFLKCRLSYRRNFVRFIIHGLHNYTLMPFEERLPRNPANSSGPTQALNPAPANEDSSNRQRSSSLGSRAVSRAPLGGRGGGVNAGGAASQASASAAFHVELTETCVDLLSRYAFTPCSVKPHRSDLAEFMFNGGQSSTWLVGHKLVTITTSGCLQNTIKMGLCDRCSTLCRQHSERAASPLPTASSSPLPMNNSTTPALQAPPNDTTAAPGDIKRQNSGENRDPIGEALAHITQRLDKISRDVETEEGNWSRVGELAGGGACPCWCAQWAEVHVRAPTGDTAWVARLQNPTAIHAHSDPLEDVAALLSAPYQSGSSTNVAPTSTAPPAAPAPAAPAQPGITEANMYQYLNVAALLSAPYQSGSSTSVPPTSIAPPAAPAPAAPAQPGITEANMGDETWRDTAYETNPGDLHKSSSDSVVTGDRPQPHAASHCIGPPAPPRMSTQPINIPGSPQRQSSSSTTDDDDMLLIAPSGKTRHPVRRSNSSPEMSSWKLSARDDLDPIRMEPDHHMIVLPPQQPTQPQNNSQTTKKVAYTYSSVTLAIKLHVVMETQHQRRSGPNQDGTRSPHDSAAAAATYATTKQLTDN
ncbi:tuberin domain-containing protein [Phthorimaea operculella]|nr:tuberin domain-containing protein [Phthorimaea operculella]